MKVKLTSIMAGPEGSHDAGTVLDLPDKQAKELIEGRYAVAYDPKDEPERAAVEPRTPNDEQAGEFGRRTIPLQTTSAKHAHAEETVKIEHGHEHKHK